MVSTVEVGDNNQLADRRVKEDSDDVTTKMFQETNCTKTCERDFTM